jgi:hypothetical protein
MDPQSSLSEVIGARLAQLDRAALDEVDRRLVDSGFLPIRREWTGTVGITTTLRLAFSNEDTGELESLEPEFQLAAIASAAERIPELASLLPIRPEAAMACPECGGSGRPFLGHDKLGDLKCGCCMSLGWVLPNGSVPSLRTPAHQQ